MTDNQSLAAETSWTVSRLALSQDINAGAASLRLFKRVFLKTLGWQATGIDAQGAPPTEADRLRIVPLVFGLIPHRALARIRHDEHIKPHIRDHLNSLNAVYDEDVVDIIKYIADQYYATQSKAATGVLTHRKKYGIFDIKALDRGLYSDMVGLQNRRCAICGILLCLATEETLDHILPWRLVGDVPSGANWQILCQACNLGKRAWFSALQSPQALNWIYNRRNQPIPGDYPTPETGYVVLATYSRCQHAGCSHTPATSRLILRKLRPSGLAIADNLAPFCEDHA